MKLDTINSQLDKLLKKHGPINGLHDEFKYIRYTDLKKRLKKVGIEYTAVARLLNRSPTGVSNRLNGHIVLRDSERELIEELIDAVEKQMERAGK